ncbi:MAG: hypothetical protein ACK49R_12735, partial [Planctomycetota bacterium]
PYDLDCPNRERSQMKTAADRLFPRRVGQGRGEVNQSLFQSKTLEQKQTPATAGPPAVPG